MVRHPCRRDPQPDEDREPGSVDRHPELASEYFRHYRKLVYLAQTRAADADERARRIAQDMGLTYELRYNGYGELGTRLRVLVAREERPARSPGGTAASQCR